jgi:hypothetical protein
LKYLRIAGLTCLLALTHIQGLAQSCPISLQIHYSDGEKGCLTDLPLSKVVDKKWGRSFADVARISRFYHVAASSTCNLLTIGANSSPILYAGRRDSESAALSQCPNKCECAIVVDNGKVLVPQKLALLIGTDATNLADKSNAVTPGNTDAAKAQKDQALLVQEGGKQKTLSTQQGVEKGGQNTNFEQTERQKDRELLLQLSAELSRLRAESESLKKAQTEGRGQVVALPVNPQSIPATPLVFANRKALVIGNDGYKFVSKLLNAKQDATSIAENLTKVGYNVTLKLDQSEKEMKATLRGFKAQVDSGDEVAIFYAGHGVQLANTNYLIPIDVAGEGEEQIKDEAISLQRILDDMADKKVKFTLAMIDACRDNPFKSSGRSIGAGARGLAPTTAATGQMVVFSAGTGQQALDRLGPNDKDKNGLFTRVFIKEMQKSGVAIDQLVRNVRNEVVTTAKSIGHDQVPAIYDQVVGEFYFRK